MRRLLLCLTMTVSGPMAAHAAALPFEESVYLPPEQTSTYVERSLNGQAPLTIEHPPVAGNPRGRLGGDSAAIAGFCRDAGVIRRRDEFGNPVILRQREVCDNVAPRTMNPGEVDRRPFWPPERRTRVLRTKG